MSEQLLLSMLNGSPVIIMLLVGILFYSTISPTYLLMHLLSLNCYVSEQFLLLSVLNGLPGIIMLLVGILFYSTLSLNYFFLHLLTLNTAMCKPPTFTSNVKWLMWNYNAISRHPLLLHPITYFLIHLLALNWYM